MSKKQTIEKTDEERVIYVSPLALEDLEISDYLQSVENIPLKSNRDFKKIKKAIDDDIFKVRYYMSKYEDHGSTILCFDMIKDGIVKDIDGLKEAIMYIYNDKQLEVQ